MTCKFSHLVFGDPVIFHATGSAICSGCGADTRNELEGKTGTYQGHSGNVDLFLFDNPFRCPSCHEMMTGYGEVCGESSDLDATFLLQIEKVLK